MKKREHNIFSIADLDTTVEGMLAGTGPLLGTIYIAAMVAGLAISILAAVTIMGIH